MKSSQEMIELITLGRKRATEVATDENSSKMPADPIENPVESDE